MRNGSFSRTTNRLFGTVFCSVVDKMSLFLLATLLTTTVCFSDCESFEECLAEARALIESVGDISGLTEASGLVDPRTGLERRDHPEEYRRRVQVVTVYLAATRVLERALQIHPGHEGVRRQRLEVGMAIGRMALQSREYLLAHLSFERLSDFGLPANRMAVLLEEVEAARTSRWAWRRARLGLIFEDLTQGLARERRPAGAPMLADYVFEVVGYRDLQTVEILGEDLEKLIQKAKQGSRVNWTQSERDRALFICRVLGRLGLPECIEPLGRWIRVVTDHALAVEVGVALCNTRHPEARPHLIAARTRLGLNSQAWRHIRRFMNRMPEAESPKMPSTATKNPLPIELKPKVAAAFINRGKVRKAKGDLQGAIDDFSNAIELVPTNASAYLNRGIARWAKRDLRGAIEDYNKAIELDPSNANAYSNRGAARQGKGDLKGAIEDYNKAIEIDPRFASAYNNRGVARNLKGDLDGAIGDYSRAIELDPRYAKAYDNRGQTRQTKGDLDGAIEDYSRAIELDPRLALAYSNRGTVRYSKGDLQGSIEDYGKAIELDPRKGQFYNNRGSARYSKGDLQGAIEDFNRAIELDPRDAKFYNNRGRARRAKGDLDGALRDYDRAVRINPGNFKTYANRGSTRYSRGDLRGALADFERALEMTPSGQQGVRRQLEGFIEKVRNQLE